jgi:hypothetical protein
VSHTFIGGTRHGEPAPDTEEDRIVAINDGTVYTRRSLEKTDAASGTRKQHDFFVYEALSSEEALAQAEPYWDGPAPQL